METNPSKDRRPAWIFTFGMDHAHPQTGESLRGCYVRVPGTRSEALDKVRRAFDHWGAQYPSEEAAGVARWGLRRIELPPPRETPAAVEPLPQFPRYAGQLRPVRGFGLARSNPIHFHMSGGAA
jgi:hypothetical protein